MTTSEVMHPEQNLLIFVLSDSTCQRVLSKQKRSHAHACRLYIRDTALWMPTGRCQRRDQRPGPMDPSGHPAADELRQARYPLHVYTAADTTQAS